jgi:hypothetical protein
MGSLEFELAILTQTQSQALDASPYLLMSAASQHAYNERRKRIIALRQMIGKIESRLPPQALATGRP